MTDVETIILAEVRELRKELKELSRFRWKVEGVLLAVAGFISLIISVMARLI